MIFGFLVQKTLSVPFCKVLASLEVILCTKNVIHSLSRHTWNLKNAIFWKLLGVTSSYFQHCLVFMIPTTGESLKKIWEVWVTWSGWFDMELPNPQWFPYKKIPISWTKGHFRGHYLDYAYTLGQKVVDKSTRLREIGFPMECFTGFFQFFTEKHKNLTFGWLGGSSLSK